MKSVFLSVSAVTDASVISGPWVAVSVKSRNENRGSHFVWKVKAQYCRPSETSLHGDLFQKSLAYAQQRKADAIYILSAKYGLVELDQIIEPYEKTLNRMSAADVQQWADKVLVELKARTDFGGDRFISLAGDKYRLLLIPHLSHVEVPLEGLGFGKQLNWLKEACSPSTTPVPPHYENAEADVPAEHTNDMCDSLHRAVAKLPLHAFPFDSAIPKNGIYALFETGEEGHGGRRIVRVGTHTGDNQLPSRLREHFITENKDRSIFRKNIGRALLNRVGDPCLKDWELDLTTAAMRALHGERIDHGKQNSVETEVTRYIQSNFRFAVIPIAATEQRLYLESRIASTVAACAECKPSPNWLGCSSPVTKIRTHGLWQVNELLKTPFSKNELAELLTRYGCFVSWQ
jgi:hypothetical protein